jgi:hypothetical protein
MQRLWQLLWQQRFLTIAGVMTTPNLFRALENEWAVVGRSAAARAAIKRWSEYEPVVAGYESPAQVVICCHVRGDPQRSKELLGAVLRLAHDELAARTVLQAVLPSLAARAWRGARWERCKGTNIEESVEELNADVLVAALERIRELAGTTPPGRPRPSWSTSGAG